MDTSSRFQILKVLEASRRNVEQLGSKRKFWFVHDDHKWLFKEVRPNTGEDWAEKVASEVASMLQLSTHHTELAEWQGRRGCAVKSFLTRPNTGLIHGNELLAGAIRDYDKDKVFGQADHTFDNIVTTFRQVFIDGKSLREASFSMAGYLVLDALVGNTDRHHQNWGLVGTWRADGSESEFSYRLAPTFDHASSLGRELTDGARQKHLDEKTVERYVRKGRGGIFLTPAARRGLSPIAVVEMLADRYHDLFKPWQTRVRDLSLDKISTLLERVPDDRMCDVARQFALQFMSVSRDLILKMS